MPSTERPHGMFARPGDTMSLLQDLVEHSVDDDYYDPSRSSAHQRQDPGGGPPEKPRRWLTAAVLVAFALVLTVTVIQTRNNRPAAESERAALISQIEEQ